MASFTTVRNGEIDLRVAVEGSGPLIVCVHGWPELWYSWRHQIAYFSQRGYTVAAMDVRGYGGSDKPHEVAAYTMRHLASDVAAVIEALSPDGTAILFGHDWGAPIVWHTSQLHPDRVSAVAGLSVPFAPLRATSFLEFIRSRYEGKFFYQIYFQDEGPAEAEFEADIRGALRKVYFASSGDAPTDAWRRESPEGGLLVGLKDPQPFPAWLSEADIDVFVEAFEKGGMRGPLNRYRAQNLDGAELIDILGKPVTQPAFFMGGERDRIRYFVPGYDAYANPGAYCTDFRGSVIVPGAGHWLQQEAPEATNEALEGFLKGL